MKKTSLSLLTALVLFGLGVNLSYAGGMKAQQDKGVTCEACQGTATPTQIAPYENCLKCHANSKGTYKGKNLDSAGHGVEKVYSESGRQRKAAMHDSHSGDIRCTVCHTAHKQPEKLYCNNCHQFDVKVP